MNKEHMITMKETIELIDDKLKETLDLDVIAKEVGISKYHLHRLFKSITGKSLMAYVRGRKLTCSLQELVDTKLNIIDIASEYQFEHEQSYIRAFKQMFEITPASYRRHQCELPIEQKIDVQSLNQVGQGMVLTPRMCVRPEFYIEGIGKEIIHEKNLTEKDTNQLAMLFQSEYLPTITEIVSDHVYIGFVKYSENPWYSNYYISSVEVKKYQECKPPLHCVTIPTSEYAVFRYMGLHSFYDISYETLKELYDYIDQWKETCSYRQTKWYHFERMDLEMCSEQYCEMDIYIPITAK